MRDDLIDARANVDWATAQIDVLRDRINAWMETTPYSPVREPDGETGYEIIKVQRNMPLPVVVNAETGVIIHMIRSSLDLLAFRLAERNGHEQPDDVYFPISKDVTVFNAHGIKKLRRLSQAHQELIRNLKPYGGGDDLLAALHQLDILRKHRQLISVNDDFRQFSITSRAEDNIKPEWLYSGKFEGGARLVRIPITVPRTHLNLTYKVTFDETVYAKGRHVVTTLREFATRVSTIITLFDTP